MPKLWSRLRLGVSLLLEHSLAVAGSVPTHSIHISVPLVGRVSTFSLVRGSSIPEVVTSKLEGEVAALLLHWTSLVNLSALSLVYSGVLSWWFLRLPRILS